MHPPYEHTFRILALSLNQSIAATVMDDSPNTRNDTDSQRQAAVLDRYLPEGYSAEPVASLSEQNLDSQHEPAPQESSQVTPPPLVESACLTDDQPSGAVPETPNNTSLSADTDSMRTAPSGLDQLKSSLELQGGDIHRDMYRIKARANSLRRANTFSHQPSPRLQPANDLTYPEQREPGGFRRHYLHQLARDRKVRGPRIVTNTFFEFLDLYGSFAGEDLLDTDSDEDSAVQDSEDPDEHRPLLQRPSFARRRSSRHASRIGDASTAKTFFTLLKAFIGTGIMFLPKAFRNGGILFSSITLISISLINCLCFRLLLDCRQKFGGGYGELGAAIVGPRFRNLILASITLSQLGFVCAGLIFTAENLLAFLNAVSKRRHTVELGVPGLIAIQLIPLIPLALIRHISKLGLVALVADVFILIGLVYIWYYDITALITDGIDRSVMLFNSSSWTLTIGSAIFTFEGIGLILPIQSSMKKPQHFAPLLYFVMLLITVIFTSIGALCYATFGEDTKIQVISNFPQDSTLVNVVQFLYSLAVLAGEPVQLFPAVRILETSLFGERASGAKSTSVKWQKNAVRLLALVTCVGVSILGATDLDKFVSLIGSFACVPLVYIYPAYLHYKGVAETKAAQSLDIALMVTGLVAMVYTTIMAVFQWIRD